ncbi:MAG: DUF4333 domain-containing protein [Propionibacteriaceae bacterium]|jgi:outer membrane murein-binding lipoprotein Lpp|nr:DUF4333 domain-containing protein [Propionibacteriaceae bacterium]
MVAAPTWANPGTDPKGLGIKGSTLAAALLAAVVLAGCAALGPRIDPVEMAQDLTDQLSQQLPELEDQLQVDCGQEQVVIEVGATLDCDLTVVGQGVFDLTVTITKVEGREYYYDFKVADEPKA